MQYGSLSLSGCFHFIFYILGVIAMLLVYLLYSKFLHIPRSDSKIQSSCSTLSVVQTLNMAVYISYVLYDISYHVISCIYKYMQLRTQSLTTNLMTPHLHYRALNTKQAPGPSFLVHVYYYLARRCRDNPFAVPINRVKARVVGGVDLCISFFDFAAAYWRRINEYKNTTRLRCMEIN